MRNMRKETPKRKIPKQQKTIMFQGCPRFPMCGPFFLGGAHVGWLWWYLLESSRHSQGWSAITGEAAPSPGHILSHRRSSLQKDCCQVGWADFEPPNSQVFPQPSRRGPSQLTMALFPSGCHLVSGRVLWAWRRVGSQAATERLWEGSA